MIPLLPVHLQIPSLPKAFPPRRMKLAKIVRPTLPQLVFSSLHREFHEAFSMRCTNMLSVVEDPEAYFKASMSDAQILDDHGDKYEFKWLGGRNKENEGKAFSKNLFESKFAGSDEFTSPESFSPSGTRNRYRNIVESPSWRREKKNSRSFSNEVHDPFVSEKRDVSNGMKSMGISIPKEGNEPRNNLFRPREDRIGLQLSPDTAQAMLPPNACVFVAK